METVPRKRVGPQLARGVPPVVVVGAGPTGLTVACGLREAGIAVRVLDAAIGPR